MESDVSLRFGAVLGHAEQKAELRMMLGEKRLPHALLFTGPEGVGKRRLAYVLAAALLCGAEDGRPCGACSSCRALHAGTNPDFCEARPERAGKSAAQIRIDQIRAICAEASRFSDAGRGRVILIDDADRMNEAAQNSLLKTLEEPAGQVTFILVTSVRNALLDTIRSRCIPISFGALSETILREALAARNIPAAEAEAVAALAGGSLGRAIRLAEGGGLAKRDAALSFLEKLPMLAMERIFPLAEAMGKGERDALSAWFSYVMMALRDMLVLYEDGGSPLLYNKDVRERLAALLSIYSKASLFDLLALACGAQKRLQANVSLRLLMEGFLIRARDRCGASI